MASQDWLNQLNSLGEKPTYESKYQSSIDDLLNKITNRESFSYDFNADPLYQQYKDQYTKLGNEASMNAAANVSSLTGGYGNSYATTAAAQANQQYLTELNNIIPKLESAALDKYQMETQDLLNQYSVVGNEEDRQYGQYRDNVSDYYTNRDYYYNGYNNERNYEYQQERDRISDEQWQKQFDYNQAINDRNYNYQVATDDRNYNYQLSRDAVSDAQWEKQYQLSKSKASSGGSSRIANSVADNTRKNLTNISGKTGYMNDAEYSRNVTRVVGSRENGSMSKTQAKEYIDNLYNNLQISQEQYIDMLRDTGVITETAYMNLLKEGY